MKREIALQEIRYRMGRLSTWIYFITLFLISFLLMVSASGGFPGKVIGGNTRELANSPYMLHMIFVNMNFIAVILISAIMGQAIYRDFDKKTWQIFFTKPMSKRDYVFGRFSGSFAVVTFITLAIGLGVWLATQMPFVEKEMLGPNRFLYFVHPYLISILPTNLVIGLVFTGLVLKTRKMTSVYIGSVILFITYAIAQELLPDMSNKVLASLVDPFGFTAFDINTKYWTVAQKNTMLLPINGLVLANRGLWLVLGIGIFSVFFHRFSMVYDEGLPKKSKKEKRLEVATSEPKTPVWLSVRKRFNTKATFNSLISEVKLEFTQSFKNRYLLLIVSLGLLFLFAMSTVVGTRFGMPTLPVTFEMLEFVLRLYSLVLLIIIIFLSGEMVWRSRSVGIDQVLDCSPLPTIYQYLSKIVALHCVIFLLLALVIPCAMLIQASKGYFNFKLEIYLFDLFVLNMTRFSLFIFLAFFIHTVLNNKALGHLLLVLYYVWGMIAPKLGFEHLLFVPMKLPKIVYSDMNGYGFFIEQWSWYAFNGYGWVLVLGVLTALLWVRGVDSNFNQRMERFRNGINLRTISAFAVGIVVLAISTGGILYNTTILNDYITNGELRKRAVEYETLYKQYESVPQPSIEDVASKVDLYPSDHKVVAEGRYILVNNTLNPLDQFIVSLPTRLLIFGNLARGFEIEKLEFNISLRNTVTDNKLGFYVYELETPLAPGDSCSCDFAVKIQREGFANSKTSTQIVKNGTFVNSYLIFPVFGYNRDKELKHPDQRKKYGLPPRSRMASIDTDAKRGLIPDQATFETVVSTQKEQIAIAPGKLVEKWQKDDRNYYRYKSEGKIWAFFTFQSARYDYTERMWQEVPLGVYYHPEHDFNVEAMLEGCEASLEYYTRAFSPFEEGDVKIVEFPRYSSFALSMPNTIPFSEQIGFIANVNRESESFIDYPFFITCHEVAHHWWGNQVAAADVQGGLLIDESLAEFSAMMVTKKQYGRDHMRRLNRYKLARYFEGRSLEIEKELPLYLMENQGYLHYEKGGLSLYAIQELIGENTMNRVLASFLSEHRYSTGSLPKSTDLIKAIKKETPQKYHETLNDIFTRITLFDLYLKDAVAVQQGKNSYRMTLNLLTQKYYADGYGNEDLALINDWIDVEVHGQSGEILYRQRVHVTSDITPLEFRVRQQPAKVIVDPDYLYINKRFENNAVDVNVEEEEKGTIGIKSI